MIEELPAAIVVLTFLAIVFAIGAAGADRWDLSWLGRLLELDGGSLSWLRRRDRGGA